MSVCKFDPARDCALCPRLVAFRRTNEEAKPDWFNGAVPSFGAANPKLLIVGLAPGLQGANRTGRPFTGDFAGNLLYATLLKSGLARGLYGREADDGIMLVDTLITNAVRCVPPANKPTPAEIATCNVFLIDALKNLTACRAILALGKIAHDAVLRATSVPLSAHPFAHGAIHALQGGRHVIDSFHCSRLNTNTGRLTPDMFEKVVAAAKSKAGLA